jgi:uncharacterized protein
MHKILILLAAFTLGHHVSAQDNNASKLALAREVITAMQADKMFDGMKGQMMQMASQMAPLPADTSPEMKKLTEDFMSKVMDLSLTEAKAMVAEMDTVYAEVYSEAELKAMAGFFKSPEGQSMIAKQPEIMNHLMPKLQGMQQAIMPKMQTLVADFKAKADALKAAATPAPVAPSAPKVEVK